MYDMQTLSGTNNILLDMNLIESGLLSLTHNSYMYIYIYIYIYIIRM